MLVTEVIQPAQRQIETVFVDPPYLKAVELLEVADAAMLRFDRATNMAGRDVLATLPASLSGVEASQSLLATIRRDGFRCSAKPAILSAATLAQVLGDDDSSEPAMCAWHSPTALIVVPTISALQNGRFVPGAIIALGTNAVRSANVEVPNPLSQRAQYATASGQVPLRDRSPAPVVQSAVFDASGSRVSITFAGQVDATMGASRQQSGPCSQLLSNVAGLLAA